MSTHYRQTHTGSYSILVQQEHSYTCQKHHKTKQIMNGRPQLCQGHHNGCWCLSLEKAFTVNALAQAAINSFLWKHVPNHQNTDGISHSHSRSRHSVLRKERGRRRAHLKHFLSNFHGTSMVMTQDLCRKNVWVLHRLQFIYLKSRVLN